MCADVLKSLKSYPEQYYAAWNGRDLGVLQKIVAPTASWIDPLLPAELSEYEEAQQFFAGASQGFPDTRFEAISEPMVDERGARVAGEWRMTGTHTGAGFPLGAPATGKRFDVKGTTDAHDQAALVVFLASPQAARLTGQAISVNGGISGA